MRRIGSTLATIIDEEYRRNNRRKMEREFIETYCAHCMNRNTNLCDIRRTINNDFRCLEYKKEE